MAIFKKKKEVKKKSHNFPELPELPEMPDLDNAGTSKFSEEDDTEPSYYNDFQATSEIKKLPSFPDSKIGNSLSQKAVKSAIEPPKKKLTMEIPAKDFDFNKKPLKIEEHNFYDAPPEKSLPEPPIIHEFKMPLPRIQMKQVSTKKANEPIYIRIDKFKFALEGFNGIKEKIGEVEKYLEEIKEQKRKEDEELREWENEIEAIKLRIEAIDNKIFSEI